MIKQLFLLVILIQPIFAMEFGSICEQPSQKEQQKALEKYKKNRESFFCGMYFYNKKHSEEEKETYFEHLKSLYFSSKKEVYIGCAICTAGTATACSTIPFACNQEFCCNHPVAWLACWLLQMGVVAADAYICDRVCKDCLQYWDQRKKMNQVQAVEQLRPIQIKVVKVE